MKLIINISNNLVGGGLQVAKSFIHLCKDFEDNHYTIIVRRSLWEALDVDQLKHIPFVNLVQVPNLKFYQLSDYLNEHINTENAQLIFTVFGPSYWHSRIPQIMGYAIPHYIYPESPYWNSISWIDKLKLKLKQVIHLRYLRRDANAIICETEDATKRIQRILNEKNLQFFTVSNTVGQHFLISEHKKFSGKYPEKKVGDIWLLTMSKYYPHKNLQIIPEVILELKSLGVRNVHFILSITREEYEKIIPDYCRTNVHTLGPVPIDECPDVYEHSDMVFLPTLLECFSANYPEAMISCKPILTSDFGFARAICREAAVFFNPLDANEIAQSIKLLIENKKLQNNLIARGHEQVKSFPSAYERTKKYLEICKHIINEQSL